MAIDLSGNNPPTTPLGHPNGHTTDPLVTDDSSTGFQLGSHWINESSDEVFICSDSTIGAAVWSSVTDSGSGSSGIPQVSKSTAYTTILTDANKHIYHPSADTTARIWTIDSNANVAYDIGTAITFVNDVSSGALTIAITSDTLVYATDGTTGSRTIAAEGVATALKVTATRWIISGVGLT